MSLAKLARKILIKDTPRSKKRSSLEREFKKENKNKSDFKNDKEKLNNAAENFARKELAKEVDAASILVRTRTEIGKDDKFQKKGTGARKVSIRSLERRGGTKGKLGKGGGSEVTGTFERANPSLARILGIPKDSPLYPKKNEALSQFNKRVRNKLSPSTRKHLDDVVKKHEESKTKTQRVGSRLAMGERVVGKAIKAAASRKARVGASATGVLAYRTAGAPGKDKDKDKGKDTRVNPSDFPVYKKGTKSAAAFRKAYNKAKREGKKTFPFEGRTYRVDTIKKKLEKAK
jgi:hypothetical protein